jgi:hypothetical protein
MRALSVVCLMLVLIPGGASAQSLASSFSVHGAAGPTIVDAGHHVSAGVGFTPMPRLTLLLDVQRTHIASRITRREHGSSAFRGGTLTAMSGEARVSLWPAQRVTPYALAGFGAGVSRPNVNATFPSRVTNSAGFLFFGGGVHVPLRERLSVFGDLRLIAGAEGNDGLLAMMPVRVGMAWRF